jgi:hydrogenase maturation protease
MRLNGGIRFIGLGNAYRTDDGLGLYAARELARRGLPGVTVMEMPGEGTALLEAWRGTWCVVLCDAISSGGTPGDVHRIDCLASPVPHSLFRSSCHTFGVAEAIALGKSLDEVPGILLLYGIEGCRFDQGEGLTDPVVRSMPQLLARIEDELAHLTPYTEPAGEHT